MRKNAPTPESILWFAIRNRKIKEQKFKRQFSIDRYVLDFYCPALRLAIEIDGGYHQSSNMKEYDLERQRSVESLGIKFLRFSNQEILDNLEAVINKISNLIPGPSPS